MKEIHYWEAEDGTRFEEQDDCLKYEYKVRWGELLEIIPCYTSNFQRINPEDELTADNVTYILIPDDDEREEGFFDALNEMDADYFHYNLPYDEAKTYNDILYREDDNVWCVWSTNIRNLRIIGNQFQLFEDKGE